MGRYERRMFFQHLCDLREGYAKRGPLDRAGSVTIAEAIEYCELIMSQMPEPSALVDEEAPLASDSVDHD